MVNKAVVGVIGVILITTLGVGALVGLQGGSAPADDANSNGNGGGGEGTPQAEDGTAAPNGTMDDGTVAPSDRTPIPGRQFTEREVASNLTERINDWRVAEGLDPLRGTGTTASRLQEMAMAHSVSMADAGELAHVLNGNDSEARYRASDLYDACVYRPPDGDYVETAEDDEFEALAETVAGDAYDAGNGTAFNEDEEAVAGALAENLMASNENSRKLLEPGLGKIGVGVEVTRDGAVYSTVNVCGD